MNSVENSKFIDDGNYDKYHLRIKDAKNQSQTVPYSDHTAATSGNFMNLKSNNLGKGTNKHFVDSEQQNI